MKALSIRQPWAWYIMVGIKDVENRDWKTDHRGPLLIHVALTVNEADRVDAQQMAKLAGWTGVPTSAELREPCGHLVGAVDLLDVVETHPSPFFQGRYGWVLARPRLFPVPVRFRGLPGLFDVPDNLIPAGFAAPGRVAGAQPLGFGSAPLDLSAPTGALPELDGNPLQKGLF